MSAVTASMLKANEHPEDTITTPLKNIPPVTATPTTKDIGGAFKTQLDATKKHLDQLYRLWGSDNFHNSVKMGTEQFNVIFKMFDEMSKSCRELMKENKVRKCYFRLGDKSCYYLEAKKFCHNIFFLAETR